MTRLLAIMLVCMLVSVPAHADIVIGYEALQQGEYDTAYQEFINLAEDGDQQAQYYIGFMYEKGYHVPQNYSEAWIWYEKAADKGHLESQLKIANLHEKGLGVPLSYIKAKQWYEKAAEQGHAGAMARLGQYYMQGRGGYINLVKASEFLKKADEGGDPNAPALLAKLAETGLVENEIPGITDPEDPTAKQILGEVNFILQRFEEPVGNRPRLVMDEKPRIAPHNNGWRVTIPKVEMVHHSERGRARIGNIRLDIVEKPMANAEDQGELLDINVVVPGSITMLKPDDSVAAIMKFRSQDFTFTWSTKLHIAMALNADYKGFSIFSIDKPISATIDSVLLKVSTEETNKEGVYDVKNTFEVDGIRMYLDRRQEIANIDRIFVSGITNRFDIISYQNYAKVVSDYMEKAIAAGSAPPGTAPALPELPDVPILWGPGKSEMVMKNMRITPPDKGGATIDLGTISMDMAFSGMDDPAGKLVFGMELSDVKLPEPKGETEEQRKIEAAQIAKIPTKAVVRFAFLNIPYDELTKTVVEALPGFIQSVQAKSRMQQMRMQGRGMNPGQMTVTATPAMPPGMMMMGIASSFKDMAAKSGVTLRIDDISAQAQDYDIRTSGQIKLVSGKTGFVEGDITVQAYGLDNLIPKPEEMMAPPQQFSPSGGATVGTTPPAPPMAKMAGPAMMLLPYRELAEKDTMDGKEFEIFKIKIPKEGKMTLNGKVLFPDPPPGAAGGTGPMMMPMGPANIPPGMDMPPVGSDMPVPPVQ